MNQAFFLSLTIFRPVLWIPLYWSATFILYTRGTLGFAPSPVGIHWSGLTGNAALQNRSKSICTYVIWSSQCLTHEPLVVCMYVVQERCITFIRICEYVLPTSSLRERSELTTEWSTRCQNIANCAFCSLASTEHLFKSIDTHTNRQSQHFPKCGDRSKSTNQELSSCLCQCWNVDCSTAIVSIWSYTNLYQASRNFLESVGETRLWKKYTGRKIPAVLPVYIPVKVAPRAVGIILYTAARRAVGI
jgi:hypothetical protein